MTDDQFRNFFERIYVINLRQRPERLAEFRRNLADADWPFVEPTVFSAIHGDTVGVPDEFTTGGGAYGCRQSHTRILEECLMDGVKGWVLIFEDDVVFRRPKTFKDDCRQFLELVTEHAKYAEGLMLGGQNHGSPKPLKPPVKGLKHTTNTQRTHAYAVRGSYMKELYRRWAGATVHIDWLMADFHHEYPVFQPDEWLCCQSGGMSDIRGAVKPCECWLDSRGDEPVVVLHAPAEVACQLRQQHGLHFGYDLDAKTGIDVGLPHVFDGGTQAEKIGRLRNWLFTVQGEARSLERTVACLYHPDATAELVKKAWPKGQVVEVTAATIDEARQQIPADLVTLRPAARQHADSVILLKAPKAVAEDLRSHGLHLGYWRDNETGIDNGLRDLFRIDPAEHVEHLTDWIHLLQREADAFYGTVAVYHPAATEEVVRQATDKKVITITADTVADALAQWGKQR